MSRSNEAADKNRKLKLKVDAPPVVVVSMTEVDEPTVVLELLVLETVVSVVVELLELVPGS